MLTFAPLGTSPTSAIARRGVQLRLGRRIMFVAAASVMVAASLTATAYFAMLMVWWTAGSSVQGWLVRCETLNRNGQTDYRLVYQYPIDNATFESSDSVSEQTYHEYEGDAEHDQDGAPVEVQVYRWGPFHMAGLTRPQSSASKNDRFILAGVATVFLWVYMGAMLINTLPRYRGQLRLLRYGTMTRGTVVRRTIERNKGYHYTVQYAFETHDGRNITGQMMTRKSAWLKIAEGAPLVVFYNPAGNDQNMAYELGEFVLKHRDVPAVPVETAPLPAAEAPAAAPPESTYNRWRDGAVVAA